MNNAENVRRPLLCRFGFHQSYLDGAWLTSVRRCNRCEWVESQADAEKLERERQLWSEGPAGESLPEGLARVALAMAKDRLHIGSYKDSREEDDGAE